MAIQRPLSKTAAMTTMARASCFSPSSPWRRRPSRSPRPTYYRRTNDIFHLAFSHTFGALVLLFSASEDDFCTSRAKCTQTLNKTRTRTRVARHHFAMMCIVVVISFQSVSLFTRVVVVVVVEKHGCFGGGVSSCVCVAGLFSVNSSESFFFWKTQTQNKNGHEKCLCTIHHTTTTTTTR